MASISNISNPTFLTENDIPAASLLGRKPDQLKISELKFWHKYRGDVGIRLKTKAEVAMQVHDYIRPWFLGEQGQKLLLITLNNLLSLLVPNFSIEIVWQITTVTLKSFKFTC